MLEPDNKPDPEVLKSLVTARMPFGRYKNSLIIELPEAYLCWWQQQGWPRGKLGQWLATAYEIRSNGLDTLLTPLRRAAQRNKG